MPIVFFKKDGALSLGCVNSGDVIDFDNLQLRTKPESSELMSCEKEELKDILGLAGKRLTNFGSASKEKICGKMLENWESTMLTIATRNDCRVFAPPDDGTHHLVDDDDDSANDFIEQQFGYSADPPSDVSISDEEPVKKTEPTSYEKFINIYIKRNKDDDKHDAFVLSVQPNQTTFKMVMNTLNVLTGAENDIFNFMYEDIEIDLNHTVGKYDMKDFEIWLKPKLRGGVANSIRVRKNMLKSKVADPITRGTDASVYEQGFKSAEEVLKLESINVSQFIGGLNGADLQKVADLVNHGKENNDVKVMKLCEFHVHGRHLITMLAKAEYSLEHLKEVLMQSVIDQFSKDNGRFMTHFKQFVSDTSRLQDRML